MKSDFSFPKKNRLLNKNDFQNLRDGSRFFVSDSLVFYTKKNLYSHSRLGIAASKKYGNAVSRNRFKRKVREAYRILPIDSKHIDILVAPNLRKLSSKKNNYISFEKQISLSFNALLDSLV
ncbi:MAG: ribonuclease P protein component [Flavobacteriaceae bacterium]|nr:ribonuclease P protein component [Flavobacteriaceae bacterium]